MTTHCHHCGYPLRGLTTGRCPECGGAFESRFPLKIVEMATPFDRRMLRTVFALTLFTTALHLFLWLELRSRTPRQFTTHPISFADITAPACAIGVYVATIFWSRSSPYARASLPVHTLAAINAVVLLLGFAYRLLFAP